MFLFSWGLEFMGWCIGWMILGIIHSIFNLKRLLFISSYCIAFRLNLQYNWFDDKLEGLIFILILPIILILFGRSSTNKTT